MGEAQRHETNAFLVCGLGALGQYCVSVLKEFGVTVNAIDTTEIKTWEVPEVPDLIDELFIGDCCHPHTLEQTKIHQYRAVLFVTSDERVNVEAAFAARSLNPDIRIIVRSAQDNLNELLSQRLGNFAAFEATQLPAPSFALAALAGETRGFFTLSDRWLRVVRVSINVHHPWCDRRLLYELNHSTRRLLTHTRKGDVPSQVFHQWEPDARVEAGDTIVYIETAEQFLSSMPRSVFSLRQILQILTQKLTVQEVRQTATRIWQEGSQTQRVAIVSGIVMLTLFVFGTIFYKLQYPEINFHDALNVALVLVIGGYDNLFGQLHLPFEIPWWLHLFSISLTVAGSIFVGILYAMLTERVLAARFQFTRRRPVPKSDHVVLVGLGRVGQRVALLLQELKQPFVGVHATIPDPSVSPQMPLVTGNLTTALSKVNLADAKSVLALTDDEVVNLEIALRAQAINPDVNLTIRTFKLSFQQNIANLLPTARVLGAYALAAEAFAAAAFGENILSLFRLSNETFLVTEYCVDTADTLNGLLLAEVAYGYEVVPILYQPETREPAKFMPSDDLRLQAGDRLVVIATIEGLQRIERGILEPRSWWVRVEKVMSQEAAFEGVAAISRVSGCDIRTARALMGQLPNTLEVPLYEHQAKRLVRELIKAQVAARWIKG